MEKIISVTFIVWLEIILLIILSIFGSFFVEKGL